MTKLLPEGRLSGLFGFLGTQVMSRVGVSALALPLAAALVGGSALPAQAADNPTSVTFTILNTCFSSNFVLKIGGTTIATVAGTGDCTCTPPLRTYTTSDPAVLALVGPPGCTNAAVEMTGNTYVAWARADITRSVSGNERICLTDTSGGNCDVVNLCSAGYISKTGETFSTNLADTDNDTVADCADPDIDNDGVLNATDNCPATPNATQADYDFNGQGDACDPPDADGDGVLGNVDNCPSVANAAQTDTNGNGLGSACDATETFVTAVPWLGSESLPHQVYSGGTMVLQAVAANGLGNAVALVSGTWDPGDGSGPQAINVSNSLALELSHAYSGADGQPFTAMVSVMDSGGNTYTDTFKVVIAPNNRETKVNMAIDKGLWNLHKRMQRTTSDGQPSGFWTGYAHFHMAATASTVQAFEINNHRESGDPTRDPYVHEVARGLRYILSQQHGALQYQGLSLQGGNDPDANGNGYGLVVSPADHSSYIGGQLIDAIVASGTPNKTAVTGQATYVRGRTYRDIVQDMLDGYSFGMNDSVGGWHYTYNQGSNDTSASHWWAIGVLAAEVWGLDAPAWVKNLQWTVGVPLMQVAPPQAGGCYFGYTGSYSNWWGDNQTNVTAAGLILMNADDIPKTHARFTCAAQWLDAKFSLSLGNFYTMYQTAKAMRTALDSTGATAPITLLNGTRDWYAAYADYLIAQQNAAGAFPSTAGSIGSYIQADMASSWAIIILSPSLFELPPTAECTASPSELGTHGGTVNFSAAGSSHPDANATIVSYSWDFGDGSATGSGVTTSHTFATPASFPTTRNAQVTVTDSNGLTDTASCPVTLVDTNVRPDAGAGGPYTMCIGTSLTLNGSASTDEDGTIASYKWDWVAPINFSSPDATTATVDATAAFTAMGPGTWDVGLQVTDNDGAVNAEFTTVTVLAANNAACNQPPVAVNDTASTFSGTPVTVTVLANDTDPDSGQTLTVTGASAPSDGVAVVNGDGTVTYTPMTGFAGTDSFTYSISDGQGGTATATVTVTVSKRSATVTAGSGTKVYGTADPVLTPSSTGFLAGITVTQTARDAGENVGSYATHATAAGATLGNYDVTYNDGSLAITPAPATAVATGGTFTYDGSAHEGTCTVTGVGSDVLSGTVSYSSGGAPTDAGSYTVTCTFAGNNNYVPASGTATLTINRAVATVTAGSGTKAYGTVDPVLTPSSAGFLAGITVSQTARDAGENVGSYATHATAAGATLGNYDVTYNDGSLVITPATATVTAGSYTKVYGTADPAITASATGFLAADGITVGATRPSGETVGNYTTTATASGDLSNYTVSYVDGSFSITRAPATVTAGSYTKVYGTADPAITASATGFLAADGITVSATRASGETVGSYTTTATASGDLSNYNVSYVDGSFSITPAALVVVANNKARHFGTPNPALDGTLTGVVAGDGISATYSTPATVGSPVGTYPITPALQDPNNRLSNYSVTITPGTLTVTNEAPVCAVQPAMQIIWPPNHKLVSVDPLGAVSDADGDSVSINVVSIFQDEPTNDTGDGNTAIDGFGVGTAAAQVRAERTGNVKNPGNGRVYYISYTATDPAGGSCSGQVAAGVPHDQGGRATPIGDGPIYNSTIATVPVAAASGKK